MRRVIKRYRGYELEFLFESGSWLTDCELLELKEELDHVNQISAHTLHYGIFHPSSRTNALRDFLSRSTLCVMRLDGEAVGFFYNVILQRVSPTVIHAGLLVIARNTGMDLMRICCSHMVLLQRRKYGNHYYTNISAIPSAIGKFGDMLSQAWPSHRSKMARPPNREYLRVLDLLYREYVQRYFPSDRIELDRKRFVLRLPVQEMGFETDLRRMPRYHKLQTNLFCMFWLDYTRGEDLVQIGKVDRIVGLRIAVYVLALEVSEWSRSLLAPKKRAEVIKLPVADSRAKELERD